MQNEPQEDKYLRELIVIMVGKRLEEFVHAGTFLQQKMPRGAYSLKFYDSMNDTPLYYPKTLPTLPGAQVEVDKHFNHVYKDYFVYKIAKRRSQKRKREPSTTRTTTS